MPKSCPTSPPAAENRQNGNIGLRPPPQTPPPGGTGRPAPAPAPAVQPPADKKHPPGQRPADRSLCPKRPHHRLAAFYMYLFYFAAGIIFADISPYDLVYARPPPRDGRDIPAVCPPLNSPSCQNTKKTADKPLPCGADITALSITAGAEKLCRIRLVNYSFCSPFSGKIPQIGTKKVRPKCLTYIMFYCSRARSRSARYFSSLRFTRCKALSMDLTWRPRSSAIS